MIRFEWLKYLLLTDGELRRVKMNPDLRFDAIGHHIPLQSHWAHTVGLWAWSSRGTIMTAAGLTEDDRRHQSRFEMYRRRAGLHTSKTFLKEARIKIANERGPAFKLDKKFVAGLEAAFANHGQVEIAQCARLHLELNIAVDKVSTGAAAKNAAAELGIMPIEVLLYADQLRYLESSMCLEPGSTNEMELSDLKQWWDTAECSVAFPHELKLSSLLSDANL